MAEGFEPYHVPQQSRRDKLRVTSHPPPPPPGCVDYQSCASLYDPSLLPPDFITCPANVHHSVKEEAAHHLMGFLGAGHMTFPDPHMSVHLNPSDFNGGGPYGYTSPPAAAHCYAATTNSGGQILSLSLSSHHQKYDFFNNSIELSKSAVPLGPFTGYASVLKGSRFLRPAHQLLEELCDMGRVVYDAGPDLGLLDPPPLDVLGIAVDDCGEQSRKKSRLLSMLDEVYKRYKQYYQQMQAAVAAFESVAGLSSAAPFANLALNAMSKHFTCLKNAITDQLQFASSNSHGRLNCERDEAQRLENSAGKSSAYVHGPFHGTGFVDPPVWRPQRGLPEHAVSVLRSWLFEHFLHPYPTDTDKLMLAKQTGLSRNQVSNWFINARVRLWKPMVEEIHSLETRQGQKPSQKYEQPPPNTMIDHLPSSSSIECENNASTSIQRIRECPSSKRTREGPTESPRENRGAMKSPYDHLMSTSNHQVRVGMSNAGGNSGTVSLTLGLHQNGLGLSDSYPINAARRFGLDSHGDEYVASGFAAQNRQFGRDHHHHHHIMEGQIMHDFVG